MGTQKNCLNEMVLLSTQNICLILLVRKYSQFYARKFCLSEPMDVVKVFEIGICIGPDKTTFVCRTGLFY